MFARNQIERLSTSLMGRLFIQREYLSLPNFLVIGNNVIEESGCTLFDVERIYGWDKYTRSYGFCLFDANTKPTAGVWHDERLAVYQDIPLGYLRLTYVVKTELEAGRSHLNNSKRYQFCADISTDGVVWGRYTHGECECG